MTDRLNLAGAVDLSNLRKSQPATAPPSDEPFNCDVPDGCGLRVRGVGPHESLKDCLDTTIPYVLRFIQAQQEATKIVAWVDEVEKANNALLNANQALAQERDRLAAELRAARRGTPAAKEGVLEGAGDLAAAMTAHAQQPEQVVRVSPDEMRSHLINNLGVDPGLVNGTADEGLETLYELVVNN